MEQYHFIIYIFLILFDIYMLNEFGVTLLGGKYRSPKALAMIYAAYTLVLAGVHNRGDPKAVLITTAIAYAVFAIIKFQGNLIKRLLVSCGFYMICIGPQIIYSIMKQGNHIDGYRLGEIGSSLDIYIMLIALRGLTYSIIKCMEQVHKSKSYGKFESNISYKLIIIPMATFCFFLSIFYADLKVSDKSAAMLIIAVTLILISNVYMFYIFNQLIEEMQKLNKKRLIERKKFMQLEKINNQNRVLLHDVNKYIRTAGELVNDSNQEVCHLFEKMGVKLQEGHKDVITKDYLLNAILTERKSKAEEWNITYNINVDLDVAVSFIDEIDLISILGNLLDNALEAARQIEKERYVSITMYMSNEGSFLCIGVENNFLQKPIAKNNRFITTKKNKDNHGIGLETVQKLVEKYGGMMQILAEENKFKVSIAMSVPQ